MAVIALINGCDWFIDESNDEFVDQRFGSFFNHLANCWYFDVSIAILDYLLSRMANLIPGKIDWFNLNSLQLVAVSIAKLEAAGV